MVDQCSSSQIKEIEKFIVYHKEASRKIIVKIPESSDKRQGVEYTKKREGNRRKE